MKKCKTGGIPINPNGLYEETGPVIVPSNRITMKKIKKPVVGISDKGDTRIMYPNEEHKFIGNSVLEVPLMQTGGNFVPTNDFRSVFEQQNPYNIPQLDLSTVSPFQPLQEFIDPNSINYPEVQGYQQPQTISQQNPLNLIDSTQGTIDPSKVNYPTVSPLQQKKDTIQKNQDFSALPFIANGIMGAIGNRMENDRQDEYKRKNLANPLNYLPQNVNTNQWVNKGTVMAQEGGEVQEDNDDDWIFEDDETPSQQTSEQESPYLAETLQHDDQPEEELVVDDSETDELDLPEETPTYAPTPMAKFDFSWDKKGSIAVRHNNPGNIEFGDFSQKFGAVQGDERPDIKGRYYARFPNIDSGLQAQKSLLQGKNYKNLTVEQAMNRWINGDASKQGAYSKHIASIFNNKRMSELTPQEMDVLVKEQIKGEDGSLAKKLGIK